jgi:enhancer of polycomb-like protein
VVVSAAHAAMSKFTFRTKALDPSKPLPIYRGDEHPDVLKETASVNRAVPAMPTGMDKEDEEVRLEMDKGGRDMGMSMHTMWCTCMREREGGGEEKKRRKGEEKRLTEKKKNFLSFSFYSLCFRRLFLYQLFHSV